MRGRLFLPRTSPASPLYPRLYKTGRYASLPPKDGGAHSWRNLTTAPALWRLLLYRPLSAVPRLVSAPVLLVAAENDTLCPLRYARRAARKLEANPEGRAGSELVVLKHAGHFDVYHGAHLRQTLQAEAAFLRKHLASREVRSGG